ncbi:DUF2795 domain-containing protein [Plantactinospora sp. KBS50]|uniref:DUF2795 domain-containing protein n=1 Tax=Plantactinospora sp. KBS50 TaxID=2024580 RepID=UPI000BAB097D|nr:DUF2795 domain-containing protein [Plantactinospora sp. KBS50]ASW56531.1 hypothetical protein CIK06_23785 [Plantactinospora sp. KBS50]
MAVNVTQLQDYLEGLDFPVSREDVVRRAQENGASTAVLQLLRSLPVEEFESPAEVGESLSELA